MFIDDTDLNKEGDQIGNWCTYWDSPLKHEDGIDVFILSGYNGDFDGKVSGIPGTYIVLNRGSEDITNWKIESSTIVHELGHLFGLYHGCTQNPTIYDHFFFS